MKETIERLYPVFKDIDDMRDLMRLQNSVLRYLNIKRFTYGVVLDVACGCGHGAWLLSDRPDIEKIYAVDRDAGAIAHAKKHFKAAKIEHVQSELQYLILSKSFKADTLISIETFEHLKDGSELNELAKTSGADNIIISFPDLKSTHFNKHHIYDYRISDIPDIFPEYLIYHKWRQNDVQIVCMTHKPKRMPWHIIRNLHDL